ncbi:hypothetical protein CBR_g27946 [Chara braunii]|uniref:Uncharacterized protein n=1 Tax=Chara braunii TaxID=69332 RepID=A0A388L8T9_CHABU|nr:hypothetical protein CBR_g27946 [Chara braunii]|eukprot:GBG78721.1 hypothetical protein CBR_g27946 [Chara braunii]
MEPLVEGGGGGALTLAGWMKDTSEDMLAIIWELEEGPDPRLDVCIDRRKADGVLSDCYTLFQEGRDLSDRLTARLVDILDREDACVVSEVIAVLSPLNTILITDGGATFFCNIDTSLADVDGNFGDEATDGVFGHGSNGVLLATAAAAAVDDEDIGGLIADVAGADDDDLHAAADAPGDAAVDNDDADDDDTHATDDDDDDDAVADAAGDDEAEIDDVHDDAAIADDDDNGGLIDDVAGPDDSALDDAGEADAAAVDDAYDDDDDTNATHDDDDAADDDNEDALDDDASPGRSRLGICSRVAAFLSVIWDGVFFFPTLPAGFVCGLWWRLGVGLLGMFAIARPAISFIGLGFRFLGLLFIFI